MGLFFFFQRTIFFKNRNTTHTSNKEGGRAAGRARRREKGRGPKPFAKRQERRPGRPKTRADDVGGSSEGSGPRAASAQGGRVLEVGDARVLRGSCLSKASLGESWLCRSQHVSPGKTVGPPHISNARVHPGWMHRLSQCDGSRFGRRAPGWGPGPPRLPRPSRMSAPLRGLGCALAGGV